MSIINRVLVEMPFRINRRVLELTFLRLMDRWNYQPVSLESQIMDLVIRPRVLYDLNVVGGTEVPIPLEGISPEIIDSAQTIYRIPKSRTNGRSILTPLRLTYYNPGMSATGMGTGLCGYSSINREAEAILNANSALPSNGTHIVSLIGENVILARGSGVLTSSAWLVALVENDENLSNFSIRSTSNLVHLCTLAVKSYIYVNMMVEIDMGHIVGGVPLETIRSIVERFESAEEEYQEYLGTTMAKVAKMQDPDTMRRLIRLQAGSYR